MHEPTDESGADPAANGAHPPGPGSPGESPGDPEDPTEEHGVPDVTLGGYFETHDRPPGFDGVDGEPYSVSMEVEKVPSLTAPWVGYLVFPRWASTGLGVVGHVQTPILHEGRTYEEVEAVLGELSLHRVKELLDEAIRKRHEEQEEEARDPHADPREAEWRRWRRD